MPRNSSLLFRTGTIQLNNVPLIGSSSSYVAAQQQQQHQQSDALFFSFFHYLFASRLRHLPVPIATATSDPESRKPSTLPREHCSCTRVRDIILQYQTYSSSSLFPWAKKATIYLVRAFSLSSCSHLSPGNSVNWLFCSPLQRAQRFYLSPSPTARLSAYPLDDEAVGVAVGPAAQGCMWWGLVVVVMGTSVQSERGREDRRESRQDQRLIAACFFIH